jgi:tetratricopeptide (TPR) repeat protein
LVCGRFEEAAEVLQALVTVPDVVDNHGVAHSSTPSGVEVNTVTSELAIGVTTRAVWASERHPDSHIALHNAGLAMLMDGSPARAAGFFEAALEIEPASYVAWAGLASCYMRLGRAQDGARCHAIATDLVPARGLPELDLFVQDHQGDGPVSLMARARGLRREAEGAEGAGAEPRARARQLEARAAACKPGSDPLENQAIVVASLLCGQYDRALARTELAVAEAAAAGSPSASDLNNRAVALMVALRFEEAAEVLDRAEALSGATRSLLVNRGNLLRMQGRVREALEVFQRCTENHPLYAPAWHGCALVHARKGDWQAAQEAMEAAVVADPVAAYAREGLAWVRRKRGL